jgi:hypothetical protein
MRVDNSGKEIGIGNAERRVLRQVLQGNRYTAKKLPIAWLRRNESVEKNGVKSSITAVNVD